MRVVGTRNLLNAAAASRVRRFVGESIVAGYGYGTSGERFDESSALARTAPLRALQPTIDAIHEQERLILDAASSGIIEVIVLCLGFYYGRDLGSTLFMARLLRRGVMPVTRAAGAMPWVELSDAARGVAAALERGRSGERARQLGTRPPRRPPAWMIKLGARYAAQMGEIDLHVSNAKARNGFGWQPRFDVVEGVRQAVPWLRASL